MADDVALKIDGIAYDGWKTVEIKRSLGTLTSSFSLGVTEKWPGQLERRTIRLGQACELYVGADLLITGWVEGRSVALTESDYTIDVSGRDRTCDLIDCSAVAKPGVWKGQTLDRIAADLVKPFGLKVKVNAPIGAAFSHFAVEAGEDAFSVLTRAAKMRGVMIGSDRQSNLVIFTPSKAVLKGSLELGRNMKKVSVDEDGTELFSQYIVKGQSQGGDWVLPSDAAGPKGEASDKGVIRYRPLLIMSNEQATAKGLEARAAWEATTRSAKAQTVSTTVRGWRDEAGALWEPGTQIPVRAAKAGVDMTLMISEVTYAIDDNGRLTQLKLVRPQAFSTEALPEAEAKKKKGRKKADATASLAPGTTIVERIK